MKIMIVDDSRAMRLIIRRTLRRAGYGNHEVVEMENGAVALDAVRADSPDLILCDWNMPEMSGIDLLKALRGEGINTTFGFITTEGTDAMRQLAMDSGASFLLAKPFTEEDLSKHLKEHVS
jgi:two-component system, chemotaxis family, chemotaxis protein CheY